MRVVDASTQSDGFDALIGDGSAASGRFASLIADVSLQLVGFVVLIVDEQAESNEHDLHIVEGYRQSSGRASALEAFGAPVS